MTRPVTLAFRGRVRASPGHVWSVLGDFGNEHRWTRLLKHSARDRERVEVGTVRRCELAKPMLGRDTIEEELVAFAPHEALAYRVRGGLGPFTVVESEWRIRPDEDGTLVEARARMTPRNALLGVLVAPLVRAYLRHALRDAVREFTTFVEARAKEAAA